MHCNLRPPDTRQSLTALITTPMPRLKSLNLSIAVLQRFDCWHLSHAVTLTFDIWPWTFVVYRQWRMQWNSVPNFSEIEQSAAELLRFEYLTLWPWTVSPVPLCSGIICTKFILSQPIRLRNATKFFMLARYVTLWSWPLTYWSWACVVDRITCGQSMYQIWARSINPQLSYWWFTTDLFVRFRGCSNTEMVVFKNAWTDLHQICWGHHQIIPTPKFKNGSDILLRFETTAAQSWD